MKQVILVTGASSGIGKETALRLIADGHTVYGAARRVDKMQELVQQGGHALAMDVTSQESIATVINEILTAQGRIDVLVNNAGYAIYGAVEDITIDEARRQFEVNIFGLAEVTRQVLPAMRQQKSGKIINISSMGGKTYIPLGAWYHATKHALEGWSDCLRLELKPFGIDVVIIEPGVILTEFGDVVLDPMVQRSNDGAYSKITNSMATIFKNSYSRKQSSPPSVIAQVIAKAVKAKRPKTRYVKGKLAKPLMFARKYFGDRIYDKMVMMQVK